MCGLTVPPGGAVVSRRRRRWARRTARAAAGAAAALVTACGSAGHQPAAAPSRSPAAGAARPRAAHVVVVMMENHSYGQVIGNPAAPFLGSLAAHGALFTNSHAVTHPSEPNYLALFSGSTQGVGDDSCPHRFAAPTLASQLAAAGLSFTGYAEDQPAAGPWACAAGEYARKHVPWANFSDVPARDARPLSAFPAGNYARLPAVAFVIPNLCHDMHNCPVGTGDAWLAAHLGGYARWARAHDSLLIVDFDENDGSPGNQIPTVFYGAMIRPGHYGERVTHYRVLRTIEYLFRLPPLGRAAATRPVTGVWAAP